MLFVAAYVLIGFLVASVMTRLYPDVMAVQAYEDPPVVVKFIGVGAIWPLIVAYWLLKGPFVLLDKYIKYLGRLN